MVVVAAAAFAEERVGFVRDAVWDDLAGEHIEQLVVAGRAEVSAMIAERQLA